MSRTNQFRMILPGLLVVFVACGDDEPLTGVQNPTTSKTAVALENELTPFQESIQQRFAQRTEAGLPAPVFTFDYVSSNGIPLSALRTHVGEVGESFTITATTVIDYSHPREAGLDRWPPLVISGSVPPDQGFIREGDYTQALRDAVEEQHPGFWDTTEFGTESRTQTITETFTVTYPVESQGKATTDDDLVHGFTFTGPDID